MGIGMLGSTITYIVHIQYMYTQLPFVLLCALMESDILHYNRTQTRMSRDSNCLHATKMLGVTNS